MSNRLPGNSFHVRFILLAVLLIPPIASAQVAGDSVNMVSGTEWPGGDPFLQRQNEPSISVSSANPMHLLAGANDYRSVDVPNPFQDGEQKKMAGDAWQGVFKSYDGGQTWKSYLMPGYPQDTSAEGLSSAAQKRDATGRAWFNASADPVVRAGTDGMFYFAGIVFRRGTSEGRVVLNRFIDLNDREGGDPLQGADSIRWIDASVIDEGSAGTYFADKPWIAVDVPRPGTPTCTIQRFGRTVAGGAVYAVWARIYSDTWADIMFSRSLDCGATWSPPLKLNDQKSQASQGASISVDPRTGYVYVAWRRFGIVGASPKQEEDAIFAVRSFSGGAKFTNPRLITTFVPYEQDQGNLRFRTEAFPTIATSTDATGTKSWTHVAWAQRGANGDGQVVMTNVVVTAPPKTFDEWTDPLDGWKIPPDPVDVTPVQDRPGGNSFTRGHQFMPALTFGQGRLVLVYYDSRLDHTRNYYTPHLDPCAPVGSCWTPNAQGRWYDEERGPLGERTGVDWVTAELDDATMTQTRHTIDVRMATAAPSASPVFTSAPLSRMPFGERGDEHDLYPGGTAPGFGAPIQVLDVGTVPAALRKLQDLQVNPPNLPMFKNGTVSFIGDYIDVQGPMFVKTATGWAFDIAPRAAPVFHAVWTSNQDVVPPANGDWTRYTPPARAQGTVSVYDPGQTLQTGCDPGYTGTRNQNVYTARISEGLVVASPQNAKRLVTGKDRTFVVSAFNATGTARTVQFSFAQPLPAGIRASFRPDVMALTPTATVTIPPRSYAVQTAFLRVLDGYDPTLVNPATTFVNVQEVGGGLSGSVTLNPPGLAYPAAVESGEVTTVQLSAASLYYANLSNANLSNANLSNANLSNANLSNANLSNANLSNANLSNSDPSAFTLEAAHLSNANLSNANLSNANLSNANLSNANLSNANLSNANLSNAALADVDYEVTNTGNTAQGFDVGLLATSLGTSAPIQLIVSRPYGKPIANGCSLLVQPDNQLVVNAGVVDPSLDPASQAPLATIAVLPGEKVRVTLRTYLTPYEARTLATRIAPFVAPQADPAAARNALVVTQPVAPLTAQVGNTFTLDLKATGGVGSLTWTVDGGTVPAPGLDAQMLSQGKLSVTPLHAGTFTFTLKVVDSATPLPNQMFKDVTMTVAQGTSTTTLAPLPATTLYGSALNLQATVAPAGATGTVTFLDGGTTLGTATVQADGTATLAIPAPGLGVGLHSVTAVFGGNADVAGSGTPAQQIRVKVDTRLVLGTLPAAPVYGTPTSLTATLASVPPGAPTPTVPAYFTEGGVTIGSGSFVAGVATSAPLLLTGGNHVYGVTFDGDDAWAPASIPGATVTVARAAILDVKVSTSKSPSYYGETVTLRATVTFSAGTPGGTVTFLVNGVSLAGPASAVVADPVIPGAPITGTAVASVSTLGVGSYTIDARYAGGTNFENAQPLTTVTQEVRGATTASLTSSPNPSALGAAVTLACTVSSTGGIPPGAPTFWDGGVQITGTPTSVAGTSTSVTWSLQTTALASGVHTLSCRYPGAGGFDAASASATQQVGPVPTSTTLAVTPASVTYGQAVTLKGAVVPVAPATGVPTGTVTFLDGATSTSPGTTLGTATAASGWTLAVSTLKVGSHAITARYDGDPLFASSTSSATPVTVTSAWTFTGFLTPLKTAGTWDAPTNSGSQNFGSAVPIKWQLTDATGAFVSDLATTTSLEAWPNTACKGPPPSGSKPVVLYRPTSGATGGSTFRYGSNTFIFNWDTTSGVSKGCFNIVLTLSDGTVKATLLTLK